MIELIVAKLTDPRFVATVLAGVAATTTVFMVAAPFGPDARPFGEHGPALLCGALLG